MRFCSSERMDALPLVIKTIEYAEGDYGLYTWPCAPLLAYLVYTNRDWVTGKHVLELGAGTAVPGITAAKVGACLTTLSDRGTSPRLMEALQRTCKLNGVSRTQLQVLPLSWGVFSPQLLQLRPQDLILASDCFYDSADFEDILVTVSYLMERNKDCVFWTSYQERSSNRSLSHLLQRWGLKSENIPLEMVQEASLSVKLEGPSPSKLDTHHTIHLWQISRL